MSDSPTREEQLNKIIAEYLAAVEAGRGLDAGEIVRQHPDLAEELAAFFRDQENFDRFASGLRSAAPRHEEAQARPDAETIAPASRPPQPEVFVTETDTPPSTPAPANIPGYEILSELGRGGMGVVYKARQIQLNRLVALKMILAGGHASAADLARFRTEADAIARLQHPHIVQIYEVGEQNGLPYFSLEYCSGGSLERKLSGTPVAPREAAALVEKLARAMHPAHEKGVVHRDLKPANILLQSKLEIQNSKSEGVGLDFGFRISEFDYKITDFGLAKTLEASGNTASGAVLGTPSYMAPEQAGKGKQVGPAADVYALGAILYELLTGRPPFRAASALDTLMQVVADEPVPPTQLQTRTPKDLETICLKCLQKEPGKRYDSALALAEDLARFQEGKPILARPVGLWERGIKWARRQPAVASLLAAVVLTLVGGTAVSAYFAVQADHRAREADDNAKDLAEANRQLDGSQKATERAGYFNSIALADQLYQGNNVAQARQVLGRCPEELRGWEWHYLWRLCHAEQRTINDVGAEVGHLVYSPDGKYLAATGHVPFASECVRLWDTSNGNKVWRDQFAAGDFCFSPDGKTVAWDGGGKVFVADLPIGSEETYRIKLRGKRLACLAFTTAGFERRLLAAGWPEPRVQERPEAPKVVHLYDVLEDKELCELPGFAGRGDALLGEATAAFSPDGKRLAVSAFLDAPGPEFLPVSIQVWSIGTRQLEQTFNDVSAGKSNLAFSPNGRLLVWGQHNSVAVADLDSKQPLRFLQGHQGEVNGVAFSQDGKMLASAGTDMMVKIRDVATGLEIMTLRGHNYPVQRVAFRADGKQLASASHGFQGEDAQVMLWDITRPPEAISFHAPSTLYSLCLAVNPQIPRFAMVGKNLKGLAPEAPEVWDLNGTSGSKRCSLDHKLETFPLGALSPDGKWLAVPSEGAVRLFDAASGKLQASPPVSWDPGAAELFSQLVPAFSSDGKYLAAAWLEEVEVDGPDKGEPDQKVPAAPVKTAMAPLIIQIWEVPSAKAVRKIRYQVQEGKPPEGRRGGTSIMSLTFGDDDNLAVGLARVEFRGNEDDLAAAVNLRGKLVDKTGEVLVFRASDGQFLQSFPTKHMLSRVALQPGGPLLAAGGGWAGDGRATIWNLKTGKEVATLRGHTDAVYSVAFSADGQRLATGSGDRTIKLWETSGVELLTLRGHKRPVTCLAFSSDGRWLVSGTGLGMDPLLAAGPTTLPAGYRLPCEVRVWDD
jgi:serine/threonine protein kinase/WD40 repeat protein